MLPVPLGELGGPCLGVFRPPLVAHAAHPDAVPRAIGREAGLSDMSVGDDDVALLPVGTMNHWVIVGDSLAGLVAISIGRGDDGPDILRQRDRCFRVVELVADIDPLLVARVPEVEVAVLAEL